MPRSSPATRGSTTEEEFVKHLGLISRDVDFAFVTFQRHEELERLAETDEGILATLNADASFWVGYRSTLQAALFMTTSRLFDEGPDTITIQGLVKAVSGNLHLFSQDALGARKMGNGPKPDWHDAFMANAWFPTEAAQLKHLKRGLGPHVSLFKKNYRPIRDSVYAHRLTSDENAIADLFSQTNSHELGKTIDFLKDLVRVIQNLYDNGVEPALGHSDLAHEKEVIRRSVEQVLRKLAQKTV